MKPNPLATPPIDLEAFRVSLRAAGIEDIAEPALALFVEESAQLVATLERALSVGDLEATRRAAHALKGSSGNVRARDLSSVAESLEATAATGDLATAADLVELTSREHSSVVDFLAENGLGS